MEVENANCYLPLISEFTAPVFVPVGSACINFGWSFHRENCNRFFSETDSQIATVK